MLVVQNAVDRTKETKMKQMKLTVDETLLRVALRNKHEKAGVEAIIRHYLDDKRKMQQEIDQLKEDARILDIEIGGVFRYIDGQFP